MDIVNCEIALGGDKGNTVPKMNVPVAEVAVLRAIHGPDAVFNIEPAGSVKINSREELTRLYETYPARDEDNELIVKRVYPGTAARVVETVEELGLPEELFKPTARATAPAAAPASGEKSAPSTVDNLLE